jgi:23S rRNA pseudouridine1911/1915/1917 synthase
MTDPVDNLEDVEPLLDTFIVEPAAVGTRLDRYVVQQLADLSRSYVQQLIADGHIRRNGREARVAEPLKAGDQVTVQRPLPRASDLVAQDLPINVVYEDADVIVVEKPVGMVVHPAPGHPDGTLVNALLWRYPEIRIGDDLRPGIVHRLDRDTSGLLVVARHDAALRDLQQQQQARTMQKVYLAVVEGGFKTEQGVIDAPVGRSHHDRQRMAVVNDGRPARTHWRVIEDLAGYTLLEVRLETGRTHQIRVHFQHKNRPVLGDPVYGLKKPRSTFGLNHQFLHAYQLGFALPGSGAAVTFTTPLPPVLSVVLGKLRVRAGGGRTDQQPQQTEPEDLVP